MPWDGFLAELGLTPGQMVIDIKKKEEASTTPSTVLCPVYPTGARACNCLGSCLFVCLFVCCFIIHWV